MNAPQALPGGPGVPQPLPQTGTHWDQDQVYLHHILQCIINDIRKKNHVNVRKRKKNLKKL